MRGIAMTSLNAQPLILTSTTSVILHMYGVRSAQYTEGLFCIFFCLAQQLCLSHGAKVVSAYLYMP